MSWSFKNQRKRLKDLFEAGNFVQGRTELESAIAEVQADPRTSAAKTELLSHLNHALRHLNAGTSATSAPETIQRLTRIFDWDPEQSV